MNDRQRWIATLTHGRPDRIPFDPGHGRESTLKRWHQEGLPPDRSQIEEVARLINLPDEALDRSERTEIGVDYLMRPQFEEKLIERRPNSQVVQDWKGNICEIGLEYDVTYLRSARDFVTRSWLKCPVESREDWEAMKQRYDLDAPGRWPEDLQQRAAKLRDRTYFSRYVFHGPFWQLREWLGFEQLCMLLADDPDFAKEMIDFWEDFMARLLERMFEVYVPDMITINEDMAYKEKPMIGPTQSRRFLADCWCRWAEIAQQAGVPVIEIDSDGHVGQLLDVWIECGITCNSPLEVAAGNDLPAYRNRYGDAMAYRGGIDKRAIAAGGEQIQNELARLKPVVDAIGYVPSCDHGVPHDVSWENFVDYSRRLATLCNWL